MSANESLKYIHPSGDRILSLMSQLEGDIGEFIRAYPGKAGGDSSSNWLDLWFHGRVEKLLISQKEALASFDIDDLLYSPRP